MAAFSACVKLAETKRPGAAQLQHVLHPAGVVTTEKVKRGSLVLAPVTVLDKLRTRQGETKGVVQLKAPCGTIVYAAAPPQVKHQSEAMTEAHLFVPFWWVETTTGEMASNVQLTTTVVDGVKIPVYQNTKRLDAHERLFRFQAKRVHEPPQGLQRGPA